MKVVSTCGSPSRPPSPRLSFELLSAAPASVWLKVGPAQHDHHCPPRIQCPALVALVANLLGATLSATCMPTSTKAAGAHAQDAPPGESPQPHAPEARLAPETPVPPARPLALG